MRDSATVDEPAHLAAGIAYLCDGAYGLYNVNPPLTKIISGLPVLLAGPDTHSVVLSQAPGQRTEFDVGDRFTRDNADRYRTLLVLARLPGLAWSLLGAWLVYRWAKQVWGPGGSAISLTLWCFEPNVIANAHLVTADLPAAVAALGAAYTLRSYLAEPRWKQAAMAGACLGGAALIKFTLLALFPAWLGIWAGAWAASIRQQGVRPRLRHLMLLLAVSLLVINLGYEFSGSCKALGQYQFVSDTLTGRDASGSTTRAGAIGNRFQGTRLADLPVPFPEAMVGGVDLQRRDLEYYASQPTYLRGEWKIGGWWYYYLYAAAVKVPIGVWGLGLVSAGMVAFGAGRRPGWRDTVTLAVPAAAIIALLLSQQNLQKHFRYTLPVFPFLIVWVGRTGTDWPSASRVRQLAAVGLTTSAVGSYLWVHPHALSYFNELAGGPASGSHHLAGSNVDWGQDLLRFKDWVSAHPEASGLRVAYYGYIDPRVYGLEFDLPPPSCLAPVGQPAAPPPSNPTEAAEFGPQPGYFAVSLRLVAGERGVVPNGRGGHQLSSFGAYAYFRRFQPVDRAGYSILIYRITADEADALRHELGLPPLTARVTGSATTLKTP